MNPAHFKNGFACDSDHQAAPNFDCKSDQITFIYFDPAEIGRFEIMGVASTGLKTCVQEFHSGAIRGRVLQTTLCPGRKRLMSVVCEESLLETYPTQKFSKEEALERLLPSSQISSFIPFRFEFSTPSAPNPVEPFGNELNIIRGRLACYKPGWVTEVCLRTDEEGGYYYCASRVEIEDVGVLIRVGNQLPAEEAVELCYQSTIKPEVEITSFLSFIGGIFTGKSWTRT